MPSRVGVGVGVAAQGPGSDSRTTQVRGGARRLFADGLLPLLGCGAVIKSFGILSIAPSPP